MPSVAEIVAEVVDRAANGPLRSPIGAVAGALQGRDPWKLARLACLAAFCAPALWTEGTWAGTLNAYLMIWFHEAGHAVFGVLPRSLDPFATLMMFLGGSLMQILVPFMFIAVAWLSRARFDACLMFLWAGLNFMAVSYYAGDAYARARPLIFGMDKGLHDWWNIMNLTGMMGATPVVAWLIWLGGPICFGVAVAGGILTAEAE